MRSRNYLKIHLLLVLSSLLLSFSAHTQETVVDTLVSIGSHNLHFTYYQGEGIPILFEAGAGDDGSSWSELAKEVHKLLGTSVIYYDRSGFGTSELNPYLENDNDFGIINGITELEKGLEALNFNEDIIIVSHSYGGFYSTLYSARNPDKVKYNIRIDANLAKQYTLDVLKKVEQDTSLNELKNHSLGTYYLGTNFANTVRHMWAIEYPENVPAIDIVSPIQRHHTNEEWQLLLTTHQDFVDESENRFGITAHGCGHYIHKDNPELILYIIAKAYLSTISEENFKIKILSKLLDKSIVELKNKSD